MRKLYLLFLILCLSFNAHAQRFDLNWNGSQEVKLFNGKSVKVAKFDQEKYFFVGNSNRPYFNFSEQNSSTFQYKINQVEKKILNSSEISNVDYFPENIEFVQNHTERNGTIEHSIQIYPFYREKNQYYRIEGFTLEKVASTQNKNYKKSVTTSVLKSGDWYKIRVPKTGVYRLDRAFFQRNGIPTNGYDLTTLKIYGNGGAQLAANTGDFRYGDLQENAIQVVGEEDGSFDANDYLIFYAQGPHNLHRTNSTTLDNLTHRFNQFDDYAYYYITFGGQKGKRVTQNTIDEPATKTFSSFDDYVFFEKDSLNINEMGRQWVSHPFYNNPTQSFNLKLHQPISGSNAVLRVSAVGKNALNTNIQVSAANINDNLTSFGDNAFSYQQKIFTVNPTNDFAVNLTYNNAANPSGLAFLDKISIAYKANLTYGNEQFNFRFLETLDPVNSFSFNGNATIWNVSDLTNATQINNNKFRNPSTQFQNEFVAFREEHLFTDAEFVEKVMNQDIRSTQGVTAVVVTSDEFLTEAQRWAQFREENDQIKVAVVTAKQIYNDFSSGSKDAFAIRDYLKHLKDNGNPNLQYVLLLGRSTYDPKNRITIAKDLIPSFLSLNSSALNSTYSTDDIFTLIGNNVNVVSDGSNDITTDYENYNPYNLLLSIGRMPAQNIAEARVMINKTISYYQPISGKGTSFGDWRLKVISVLDDEETGEKDINNPLIDEQYNTVFNQTNNQYYSVKKLYVDGTVPENTSAGLRYPTINQGIINGFELGANYISYFGHGGPSSWAQERLLTFEDLSNLSNFNAVYSRLPIVSTVTCDFTVWDLPQYNSAGEEMVKNANGGALVMLTTNRPIGIIYGEKMNGIILSQMFKESAHQNVPIGDALRISKQVYGTNADHKEVTIIGDPMVALARPQFDIRVNSIKANGAVYPSETNQLKALDFITIEGEVLNANGQVNTNFNGTVTNIIYEKEITSSFLRVWPGQTFKEESAVLFKGNSKVTNGKFVMEYYIPKDINYEVGERKFVLYAHNEQTDAVNVSRVNVGGLNEANLNDGEIPQGKLYMNNLNFANGGITDRDPYLVGCLTDNMGINSSGASIGHDIVATMDGNIQDSYVLNEYYESGDNNPCINKNFKDYQKGQVVYQLKNLELGQHTVTLKFWDINNNSNSASLDFVVMENGNSQLHIDKLLNWPNPFTNSTYFHFEHNCDSELEVLVQIFTVSGKLVKSIKQYVTSEPFREGYRTNKYAIPWDGLDDFGDKIGKGVYIYKVNVKGVNGETCKGTAQGVEKLVILK